MDPVTLAIVAALAGGALSGAVTPPFADAYSALKGLIKTKFGYTKVPMAIESLEETPDSEPWQEVLKAEILRAGIDKDEEIREAADALLDQVKAQPQGQKLVQQLAIGSYIVQAEGSSTATQNINQPKE